MLTSYAPNSGDIPLNKLLLNAGRQTVESSVDFERNIEYNKNLVFTTHGTQDNPILSSDEPMILHNTGIVRCVRQYDPEVKGDIYVFERPYDDDTHSGVPPEGSVIITKPMSDLPFNMIGYLYVENNVPRLYIVGAQTRFDIPYPVNLSVQYWIIYAYILQYIPPDENYEEKRKLLKPRGGTFQPADPIQREVPVTPKPTLAPKPKGTWDFSTMSYSDATQEAVKFVVPIIAHEYAPI